MIIGIAFASTLVVLKSKKIFVKEGKKIICGMWQENLREKNTVVIGMFE